jgi:hypothetical protein
VRASALKYRSAALKYKRIFGTSEFRTRRRRLPEEICQAIIYRPARLRIYLFFPEMTPDTDPKYRSVETLKRPRRLECVRSILFPSSFIRGSY